jgi:hypothetical protein
MDNLLCTCDAIKAIILSEQLENNHNKPMYSCQDGKTTNRDYMSSPHARIFGKQHHRYVLPQNHTLLNILLTNITSTCDIVIQLGQCIDLCYSMFDEELAIIHAHECLSKSRYDSKTLLLHDSNIADDIENGIPFVIDAVPC